MKRGRHYYDYPMVTPPRKRNKGIIVVLVVIAIAAIYLYFSTSGSFKINLPNFGGNQSVASGNQGSLTSICIQNVNDCGRIIKSKYDSSVTVLASSEFKNVSGANQFLNTWGPSSQISEISYYTDQFPVILVATRFDNSDGTKTPHVFVCKSDGGIEAKSKAGLC